MHSGVVHGSKHRCVSAHVNGTNPHFEALALTFELSTMMMMMVTTIAPITVAPLSHHAVAHYTVAPIKYVAPIK